MIQGKQIESHSFDFGKLLLLLVGNLVLFGGGGELLFKVARGGGNRVSLSKLSRQERHIASFTLLVLLQVHNYKIVFWIKTVFEIQISKI